MTERLGGLGQFQHKGKRFEPAGFAGGTKAIMSPDILGYYKPGSAYTSGEALASAARVIQDCLVFQKLLLVQRQ